MRKENKGKSPCLSLLIVSLCSLVILAHFVSSFFPQSRLWGLNHLAYFPLEFGIGLTVFFFIFLIPGINFKILNLFRIPADLIYRITFNRSKKLWFFLFSCISFSLFWLFRTRTHFLGDGNNIINSLQKGEFFVKWTEPIETLIYNNLYKFVNSVINLDADTLYELVSCFYGVIFIFLIFLLIDFLGRDKWEKLFLFCFFMFMGSIQLFCGYAEHYSFSYILLFAFIYLSIRYLEGQKNPFLPLLVFMLALFSHVSVSYLLPSAFLLCFLGYKKSGKFSFLRKKETWAVLFLIVISVIFMLYMREHSWTVGNRYVPLTKGDYYGPGYSLFSFPHILDILNQQLLVSPVGLVVLISVWACLKAFYLKDKTSLFLFSTFVLGMGFNSIMYPGLGMSRDWDMFSSTAIGYTVLAGYLFLRYAKKRIDFKYVGSIVIITVAFCTLPWILLNSSEQKGVERFRNLLDLDPKKSRNGHYTLAAYFDKKGLYQEVEKENQTQARKFPELTLVNESFKLFSNNQIKKALELCNKAFELEPDFAEVYLLLGKIYDSKGEHYLAKKQFDLAQLLKPGAGNVYVSLGTHYVITNSYDSACYYYKKALYLNVKDKDVYNNLGNIYSMRKKWSDAIHSYNQALKLDPDFAEAYYGLGVIFLQKGQTDQAISRFRKASEVKPDFALAHYHLAFLYAQKGEREKAQKELEIYSRYASDKKEVEKLKEMMESLFNK